MFSSLANRVSQEDVVDSVLNDDARLRDGGYSSAQETMKHWQRSLFLDATKRLENLPQHAKRLEGSSQVPG